MRKLCKEELIPGMIVAEDVYDKNHQLIVAEKAVLTHGLIKRLEVHDISYIKIGDSILSTEYANNKNEDFDEDESEKEKAFNEKYQKKLDEFEFVLNDLVEKNGDIDEDRIFQMVDDILEHKNKYVNVVDLTKYLRKYDDSTYAHSVNVALLANIFAQWLGMDEAMVKLVTIAGMLHDIGKMKIPEEIIKKPGKLTKEEFEIIMSHPVEGYKLLREHNIEDSIKNAALMHHEKCDGTGYPLHLKTTQIDPVAKLIAIVDVYDAMTSARVYRGPMCPFDVIDIFKEEGLQKYDTKYIMTFLQRVAESYIRETVTLSDGREGQIIFINPVDVSRPLVDCGNEIVDLSKRKDLKILKVNM